MTLFKINRFCYSSIRFVLISLIAIALVIGGGAIAHSQLPGIPTNSSKDPLKPPQGVTRQGEYEIAPVKSPLDNKVLFEVVAPTVFNRDQLPEESLPVEVRAEELTQRLWRAAQRTIGTKQNPVVSVAILNNRPILQVRDDHTARPLRLVTVTEPDADYYGETLEGLAQKWQKTLQVEVNRLKRLLAPEVLLHRIWQAMQIGIGLLLASIVLWWLWRTVSRKEKTLQARHQAELADAEQAAINHPDSITPSDDDGMQANEAKTAALSHQRSKFLARIQRQFNIKRQLGIYSLFKWVLLWTFILMWYAGIVMILSRIPILMGWVNRALATPLLLIMLWFIISLAMRISKSSIDRFTHTWTKKRYLSLAESQRIALRAATISGSLKGLSTFLLMMLGILWTLGLFNIPTSSILAGGAIFGLAISFGSQSLIKDLVNGCLIITEDQFAVGDVIQVGNEGGLVENLNLRITQLRNSEGQLITIPNSIISEVKNLTRHWSRVDFSIEVAYENDPQKVLSVLHQVAEQLYNEPEWRDHMPNPPEVLGIDAMSHTGMLMRVWIQTAPMQQWLVGREFRLRVRQAFEANNVQIGKPQWISYNTDLVDNIRVLPPMKV